jgi:hypothetical protein
MCAFVSCKSSLSAAVSWWHRVNEKFGSSDNTHVLFCFSFHFSSLVLTDVFTLFFTSVLQMVSILNFQCKHVIWRSLQTCSQRLLTHFHYDNLAIFFRDAKTTQNTVHLPHSHCFKLQQFYGCFMCHLRVSEYLCVQPSRGQHVLLILKTMFSDVHSYTHF